MARYWHQLGASSILVGRVLRVGSLSVEAPALLPNRTGLVERFVLRLAHRAQGTSHPSGV